MDRINLDNSLGEVSISIDTSQDPKYVLLMAHGAGAGYDHKFMVTLAKSISNLHGTVIRFNFPYIEQGKKFPGSPKTNIRAIGCVVSHFKKAFPNTPMFLSGKSYGGRMSSHWVHENQNVEIHGLVYFGFPLHAPGKAGKERAKHLPEINIPQLFIQGTNDALAKYDLIQEVAKTCRKGELATISGGDHSFKIPKKDTNKTHLEIIQELGQITDEWTIKQIS